jgi:hypothetical protein
MPPWTLSASAASEGEELCSALGELGIGLVVEAPGATARERGIPTGPRSMKFGCGGEGGVGIGLDGYEDALHGARPPGVGYIGCGTLLSCCE